MPLTNRTAFRFRIKGIKLPLATRARFLYPAKAQFPVFAHPLVDAYRIYGTDHGAAVAAGTG
ncbi:hypothetical protein D3C75_1096360 [compost metagenome]